jgi:uncharacterized protein (TIGR04255 family)
MPENTPKYKNPPLTEAIFELFFEAENWTPAVPGLFFSSVSKEYPIITQAQNGIGFILGPGGLQIDSGNNALTQYKSADGSSIIQLSNGLLTVNKLPEYSGWNSYRDSILDALSKLQKLVTIKKINRLGLKALNKIDIKSHSLSEFKKFYTILPTFPEGLNHDWSSIQMNFEVPKNEGNDILALSIATILKEPKFEAPTLMQLYFTRTKNADSTNPKEWIEEAHLNLKQLFESSLTANCKKNFE